MLRLYSWSVVQFWEQLISPNHAQQSYFDQPVAKDGLTQTETNAQQKQMKAIKTTCRIKGT